ncbi:transcription intermediary factor 1-beta-like [Mercenaria mercenaria]|uniref:transcription intermediary factor 1-beta-like n=1 Tax=Mercenaria mercenaria TaxID=6596 RepID=UPI00234F2521|nr:transcription intermediary factor 1-beta-like [Mercenaria mercenaria]
MAAKGSTTDASDEFFDFVCSPCNKKDRNTEAVKYCADCQEYLCGACVIHHNSFAVLAGHTLVGRSKSGNTSGADIKHLPSVPTERCTIHKTKLMDMFCADHDSIGCHVCFTSNHKTCQNIHYFPEFVQSVRQDENDKRVAKEIKTVMSVAEYFMKRNQKARKENSKSKMVCLKEIKSFRADINEVTDQLEKASVAEIEENHNELDKILQLKIDNMHDTLDKLTKYEAEMRSSQNNPSQLFVATKLCKEIILDTEKCMQVEEQRTCLAFTRNQNIHKVLQNCDSLGEQNCTRQEDLYEILSQKATT